MRFTQGTSEDTHSSYAQVTLDFNWQKRAQFCTNKHHWRVFLAQASATVQMEIHMPQVRQKKFSHCACRSNMRYNPVYNMMQGLNEF